MNATHPTASEMELYVVGALDRASGAAFESHVAACDVCASALAREARWEMDVCSLAVELVAPVAPVAAAEVLRHARPLGRIERVARAGAGLIGVTAAAAMLLFALGPRVVPAGSHGAPAAVPPAAESPWQQPELVAYPDGSDDRVSASGWDVAPIR